MSYPIQPGKIQAPALRDETLARTRLLDWLETKIHSRVLFVIADAGYGKTTLLADFSRRTRHRTLWYRLDEDDRDWVGFLSHLVAAGREHEPAFAPRTASMLRALEPGGPTREDVIEAFLAELPSIAPEGAALILDDFHLADEVADVRHIVREIVSRGPERLSIVFASRRTPPIPVSKLRSLGEVAELGIADLRFSNTEVEQLFRETYRRPLEPDVLTELSERTEGWAASLTLVQAALRERSTAETRSFIRGLSGAHDELHDYLAEEVVGDLPRIHQQFLMRTSVLQVVTPELAQVATGLTAVEVQSLMLESERLGLLGRRPNRRSAEQRYHPLVREFLEDRLLREIGAADLDELHVAVASWAEPMDWRTAAHHYATAERWDDLHRVLDRHLENIVASGAFAAAATYVPLLVGGSGATREVLLSRSASAAGDFERVTRHAEVAAALEPGRDAVVANLLAAHLMRGRYEDAADVGKQLAKSATSSIHREIAEASVAMIEASLDGPLGDLTERCEALAKRSAAESLDHFEGVSWLNAGLAYLAAGDFDRATAAAARAVHALSRSSSGTELASAKSVSAALLAIRGDLEGARERFREYLRDVVGGARVEFVSEFAETEAHLGSADISRQLLASRSDSAKNSSTELVEVLRVILAVRENEHELAQELALQLPLNRPTANSGFQSRIRAVQALTAALSGDPAAERLATEAAQKAERQGAGLWLSLALVVLGYESRRLDASLVSLPEQHRVVLSYAAELVARGLHTLGPAAFDLVATQAATYKERWRPALRREMQAARESRLPAARLLDVVGEASDIATLRTVARESRRSPTDAMLGRGLARRLAPVAEINDLGRITIKLGDLVLGSGQVRRKVLALIAFLLTRPRWTASREEVMEAMWPDLDPASAVNSLNQTVYFLRRVFEPNYSEDTSAGYVHQDSDLIWLDAEMIRAQSAVCSRLIADFAQDSRPEIARALADSYRGRFALDFAYDEWSSDFREWLHVAFLQTVETQLRRDLDNGTYELGASIARSALAVEPRSEDLELSLLRLLRATGAHTAAAEQYERYAHILREDLGVEPPAIDRV